MAEPVVPTEDGDLYSRRTLAQILAVVIVSSMFVLALYLVGVIGTAREDAAPATTVEVEQMPPTVEQMPPTLPTTATTSPAESSPVTEPPSTPPANTATEATSPAPVDTEPSSPVPTTGAPVDLLRDVQVSASDVRADGSDSCGTSTSYDPLFAFDMVPETAWMVDGDGVGAELTIELAGPMTVSRLGLVPGYAKIDPCTGTDRFDELRRITAVRWTLDDDTSIDHALGSIRTLQTIAVNPPVVASRITMTIVSTTEPGIDRLDHTAVSEVVAS